MKWIDGLVVAIIRRTQWMISLAVLIYGVALFRYIGLTAIIIVGIGLVYCALAAWASRLTIISLSVVLIADCGLALMSWRLLIGSLESVSVNSVFQGREAGLADYIVLDVMASSVILVLVALYIGIVIMKWKELIGRRKWL